MTHLKRAGILLAAVLVFVFIGLRVIPAPAFLVNFGFHQRDIEQNTERWANLPMQFASSSLCLDCHKATYTMWQQGNHQTVNCENCHGPAIEHLESGMPLTIDASRELCGLCHAKVFTRPNDFPQVDMEEMGGDADCITCHNPHEPRAEMPPQIPHTMDGRSECQTCHSTHEPLILTPPKIPHSLEERTDCLLCHGKGFELGTPPKIPHTIETDTNCLVCHNTSAIKPFPEDHVGRTLDACLNCHQSR